MTGDDGIETSAISTEPGMNQLVKFAMKISSPVLNGSFSKSSQMLTGCGLRLDFQRSKLSRHLNAFFSETEFCGTLELSHYLANHFESPFSGVVVNEFCGFHEAANNTAIFTKYVDLAYVFALEADEARM